MTHLYANNNTIHVEECMYCKLKNIIFFVVKTVFK